jgi:2,3-bisphosphoglycerate-dependent phosphoglycerate mutase
MTNCCSRFALDNIYCFPEWNAENLFRFCGFFTQRRQTTEQDVIRHYGTGRERDMSQLFVLRHGQTDWNAESRYQGATDVVLNAIGRQQANEVAMWIRRNHTIDTVVSSPLNRAQETALIIATTLHRDVRMMEQFAERHVGVYEGLTPQEAQARYPDVWAQNITRQLNTAPPGGETILEVGARVRDGLNYLGTHYQGKNILLVAHGYIARMIYGIVNRVSDDQFHSYRLGNGEIAVHQL